MLRVVVADDITPPRILEARAVNFSSPNITDHATGPQDHPQSMANDLAGPLKPTSPRLSDPLNLALRALGSSTAAGPCCRALFALQAFAMARPLLKCQNQRCDMN